ncbi:MAG: S8 family serine peptidase [Planctomycetota bacterium]
MHPLHPLRSGWPLATILLLSTAFAQQPAGDGPYRHYDGKKEAFAVDHTRLAVLWSTEVTPAELVAALGSRGVDAASAEPTGIGHWHLVRLGAPFADRAALRGALARVLQDGTVPFAAPVFFGRDGGWATVTPGLLFAANGGTAASALAVLQELVPTATLREREFGGMPGALRATSASRNGLDVLAEANRLAEDQRVAWGEPDWQFSGTADLIPNDPGWPQLWGMLNTGQFAGVAGMDMDCDLGWDVTIGSNTVKVAVLDTGVQQGHPDINQLAGSDFTGQGSAGGGPFNACDNHGTPVGGCVSAIINNALGTVGSAPGCRTISARAFVSTMACDGSWSSQASYTVNALGFAQAQGCRVTNNSNGYGFTSAAIDAQYQATYNAGLVHFASAGNSAAATITYPASLAIVNGVSAVGPNGNLAAFSNHGTGVDFAGPGVSVYSTDRTGAAGYAAGDYTLVQGTSFASPYAAGIAALVISQNPTMSALHVELAMRAARDRGAAGFDTFYGSGLVNANSALRSIPYGTGLAGTGGFVPRLFAGGILRLGNTIGVAVDSGYGGSFAVIAVGNAPAAIPALGGTLLVLPPLATSVIGLTGLFGAPGVGAGTLPVFIPNNPALINASVYLQAGVLDPLPPADLSLSNGLRIRMGP